LFSLWRVSLLCRRGIIAGREPTNERKRRVKKKHVEGCSKEAFVSLLLSVEGQPRRLRGSLSEPRRAAPFLRGTQIRHVFAPTRILSSLQRLGLPSPLFPFIDSFEASKWFVSLVIYFVWIVRYLNLRVHLLVIIILDWMFFYAYAHLLSLNLYMIDVLVADLFK